MAEDSSDSKASPLAEGAKATLATAVAVLPMVAPETGLFGPLLSAGLWGLLQASTEMRAQRSSRQLEIDAERARTTPTRLFADPLFRAGLAQLKFSVATEESDSKLRRIHAFLQHRMVSPSGLALVDEAVLRAFASLPASHIEQFLSLIATNDADLEDFSQTAGSATIDIEALVASEFASSSEDNDHCGSPANARLTALVILLGSLSSAGLVEPVPTRSALPVHRTTELAKPFVAYCLPTFPLDPLLECTV